MVKTFLAVVKVYTDSCWLENRAREIARNTAENSEGRVACGYKGKVGIKKYQPVASSKAATVFKTRIVPLR